MQQTDITLNDFMNICRSWDNKNGSWSVEITLKNLTKSTLTVDNCNSEYDAKERAFLYLKSLLIQKNNNV